MGPGRNRPKSQQSAHNGSAGSRNICSAPSRLPARRPGKHLQPIDDGGLFAGNSLMSVGSWSTGYSSCTGRSLPSSSQSMRGSQSDSQLLPGKKRRNKLDPLPILGLRDPINFDQMFKMAKGRARCTAAVDRLGGGGFSRLQSPLSAQLSPLDGSVIPNYPSVLSMFGGVLNPSSTEEIDWSYSTLVEAASKTKCYPKGSDMSARTQSKARCSSSDNQMFGRRSSAGSKRMSVCEREGSESPASDEMDSSVRSRRPSKHRMGHCDTMTSTSTRKSIHPSELTDKDKADMFSSFGANSEEVSKTSLRNVPGYLNNVRQSIYQWSHRSNVGADQAIHAVSKRSSIVLVKKPGEAHHEADDIEKMLHVGVFDNTEHEFERMRVSFCRYCKDSEVHIDDLGDVLQHLGYLKEPSMHTDVVRQLAAEVTTYASLDFPEVVDFVDRYVGWEREHFERMFEEFDEEDNGELDEHELYKLLVALHMSPLRETLTEAFEVVDADDSGTLDMTEFIHLVGVYRVTEGFTRQEVQWLSRVFGRFSISGSSGEPEMQERMLEPALLHMFGPQAIGTANVIAADLKATSKNTIDPQATPKEYHRSLAPPKEDMLSFSEFLVWARRMREAEMRQYHTDFSKYDIDGSGQIDTGELVGLLQGMGYMPLKDMVDEVLAAVDYDNSGDIDFEEFCDLMALFRKLDGFSESETESYRQVFNSHDESNDGEIQTIELLLIFKHYGYALQVEDVRQFIDKVDVNGTGSLDFREFVHLMRLHREDGLRKVKAVYNRAKNPSSGVMSRQNLVSAIKALGYEIKEESLGPILSSFGGGAHIEFDKFVRITDLVRLSVQGDRKKRAGFSIGEVDHFWSVFEHYDDDHNGFIEKHELTNLVADLQIPMKNKNDQKAFLATLDGAREAARTAGVPEDQIGDMGKAEIKFWPLVHLIFMMNLEADANAVIAETEAVAEVNFLHKEVVEFREIFTYWAVRSDETRSGYSGGQNSDPQAQAKKSAAAMAILAKDQETSRMTTHPKWLSGDGIRRVVRSLGMSLNPKCHAMLEIKLGSFHLDDRGRINFPDFLRLMRWMLDSNFAEIHNYIKPDYASVEEGNW